MCSSDFGFHVTRCQICDQVGCTFGTFFFEQDTKNTDIHNYYCTFGNFESEFDEAVMETKDSKTWWPTIFPSVSLEDVPESEFPAVFPDVSSVGTFKTFCETCGQTDCTWGTFSFETNEDTETSKFHKTRFDCARTGCKFGDNLSNFEEGEIVETEEASSWWPSPFQAAAKATISLADILKKFCKCRLDLQEMKVNKDQCLLHGIHSDADEEEEFDDEDDGYYCW